MIGGATTVHSGVVSSLQCFARLGIAVQCSASPGSAMHGYFQSRRCSAMLCMALHGFAAPSYALLCVAWQCTETFNHSGAQQCRARLCQVGSGHVLLGYVWQCTETFNHRHPWRRMAAHRTTLPGAAWLGNARKLKEKSCTNHYQIQTKESL